MLATYQRLLGSTDKLLVASHGVRIFYFDSSEPSMAVYLLHAISRVRFERHALIRAAAGGAMREKNLILVEAGLSLAGE